MSETVVHVLNGLRFGGNESLCLQLLRHAPPNVRNVLVNIDPSRTEMSSVFAGVGEFATVNVAYDAKSRAAFTMRLATVLSRLRPTAMLTYPFGQHVLTSAAARMAGCTRMGVHAGNPPPKPGEPRRMLWAGIVSASAALDSPIWFCSYTVENAFKSLGVILPRRSRTIWNGCDVEALNQRARSVKRATKRPVIGMIARLNQIKDQSTLIRAMASLIKRGTDAELWLVGDGETRGALKSLARQLGIAEQVKLLGERADVAELLGQMDLFAFSTTADEGFGIALIEAMAAGVPVVASDVPACREVIGDAGRLVPPGEPELMANEIHGLLNRPEQAKELSRLGHAHVLRRYDAAACAKHYYEALLGDGA